MQLMHLRAVSQSVVVAMCLMSPIVARGQAATQSPISAGVQGGLTLPTGDFGNAAKTGWHLGGYVQARPANQVFGVRGELQYHRNDLTDEAILDAGGDAGTTGHFSILYVGLDGVMEVAPSTGSVGWFLLAGPGYYHETETITDQGIDVSASDSKIGFNVGGGLRFKMGGMGVFVDARYHTFKVGNSTFSMIPISIGLGWP